MPSRWIFSSSRINKYKEWRSDELCVELDRVVRRRQVRLMLHGSGESGVYEVAKSISHS